MVKLCTMYFILHLLRKFLRSCTTVASSIRQEFVISLLKSLSKHILDSNDANILGISLTWVIRTSLVHETTLC